MLCFFLLQNNVDVIVAQHLSNAGYLRDKLPDLKLSCPKAAGVIGYAGRSPTLNPELVNEHAPSSHLLTCQLWGGVNRSCPMRCGGGWYNVTPSRSFRWLTIAHLIPRLAEAVRLSAVRG